MAAISPPMMTALQAILQQRLVPSLPPLLGNQNPEANQRKQISRAFNAFVLQKLFDLTTNDASSAVVDDFADNGIDAIYYHEPDETLYLLQSKLKATDKFLQGEAESLARGIRLLVEQELATFNQLVLDKAGYIENALDHCSHIKLIIAYTGNGITQTAINVLDQFVNDQTLDEERINDEILYIDSVQVETWLREEQSIQLVNTRLKLSHSNKIDTPRKTVFGLAKIDDLVSLHVEHDKALYQKNIRYFIGAGRRGVNQAIKNTLENNPDNFLYLNNGITAVCTGLDPKRSQGGYKDYVVAGFSVVNGAQTISSAAQFKQANPDADTSSAKVMLTLILTPASGDFHKTVTKARNLQNPVTFSNFAVLDDNQERIRQEMALHGIDYHYRPQQPARGNAQIIDLDTLSKALACLHSNNDFPARLKTEPSLFTNTESSAYQALFNDSLTGCKAINAVNVYKVIHELLIRAEQSSYSPEKLVYRHCLYPLASILIKRFKVRIEGAEILKDNVIRTLISAPFDDLRQKFSDQYQISAVGMHHAFFKRIADTARLTQKVTITYQNMQADQTALQLQGQVDHQDPYNQALSQYLVSKVVQI